MVVRKGIIYYTDNTLDGYISHKVQNQILMSGIPVISVSLKPISFGDNIVINGERGYLSMFMQILAGLDHSDADVIFFCEHDVLYHPSHFDFTPEDNKYYYNINFYKYKLSTGQMVGYDARLLSQLCANKNILLSHYENRVRALKSGSKLRSEPGTRKGIDDHPTETWRSTYPNIDIRHGKNLTGTSRFSPEEFRNKNNCKNWRETNIFEIEGWDSKYLSEWK